MGAHEWTALARRVGYCKTVLIAAARARATSDGLWVPCWRNAVSFVQASPICGHVGE